jgi:hypothetical protein
MFTSVDAIKSELGSLVTVGNDVLTTKIQEASADIELALGWRVPQETVEETFWHGGFVAYRGIGPESADRAEPLFLRRKAVSAITSIVLDDDTLDPSEYRLDPDAGAIYRFDSLSGLPRSWIFCKSIVATYVAGYVLSGQSANVPAALQSCTKKLVKSFLLNLKRDQSLRSQNIPGVAEFAYWSGSVADPEQLPSEILAELALLRRPRVAVA